MKRHYFDQPIADVDDVLLKMSISQGMVPKTCLLGGREVIKATSVKKDPCETCEGPRSKCRGRPYKIAMPQL
jgi:hypothetical protein